MFPVKDSRSIAGTEILALLRRDGPRLRRRAPRCDTDVQKLPARVSSCTCTSSAPNCSREPVGARRRIAR
eukprot:scaffold65433_cov66-Phaeocystis_antarctica.AAC.11